jgi:hypothetical protein
VELFHPGDKRQAAQELKLIFRVLEASCPNTPPGSAGWCRLNCAKQKLFEITFPGRLLGSTARLDSTAQFPRGHGDAAAIRTSCFPGLPPSRGRRARKEQTLLSKARAAPVQNMFFSNGPIGIRSAALLDSLARPLRARQPGEAAAAELRAVGCRACSRQAGPKRAEAHFKNFCGLHPQKDFLKLTQTHAFRKLFQDRSVRPNCIQGRHVKLQHPGLRAARSRACSREAGHDSAEAPSRALEATIAKRARIVWGLMKPMGN